MFSNSCFLCFASPSPQAEEIGLSYNQHPEQLPVGYVYVCSTCHERKFGFQTITFLTITTIATLALSRTIGGPYSAGSR